jgi:hypothetical protein
MAFKVRRKARIPYCLGIEMTGQGYQKRKGQDRIMFE